MSKNLNNSFANLLTPETAMRALGSKTVIQVQFDDSEGFSLRTQIPNMPDKQVETFLIMNRRIGRGQIGPWKRVEVVAR